MPLEDAITSAAKKEYSEFENEISASVEDKMKNYLSGFTDYLQKTAFEKSED